MFDNKLLQFTKHPLTLLAKVCVKNNIRAVHITLCNIPLTIILFLCILLQLYIAAVILIVINRVFDGLDGAVARISNTSSASGGFLDIMVDYLFYAAVPLAHGWVNPSDNTYATIFILSAYVLGGVCFMATSSAAQTLGIQSLSFPQKKIYYPINLIEGFETIVYFIIVTLFPKLFPTMSYIIAGFIFISLPFLVYIRYKQFTSVEREQAQEPE